MMSADTGVDVIRAAKRTKIDASLSTPSHSQFITDALLHHTVESIAHKSNQIFVAERDDKLKDVWKGMIEHRFLSVPVLQKTEHKYYGVLDLHDIVRHLVNHFEKIGPSSTKMSEEAFWAEAKEAEAFGDVTVNDVMQYPLTRKNPFHPVQKGYSLLYAMELLAREPTLHRVPVVNKDRKIVNLITQSKFVEFLHSNKDKLGDILDTKVGDVQSWIHPVLTVSEDDTAIKAFDSMVKQDITGLPVVDETGKLTGHLSLGDLKIVGSTLRNFWRFYQTVKNFVRHLKEETAKADRPRTFIYATKEDTIGSVLDKLHDHHVHRLFIVDDKTTRVPIGVVSLREILLFFLSR